MMTLIKEDVDLMTDLIAQAATAARKQAQQRGSQPDQMLWGHGGHAKMGHMLHGAEASVQ
jgi:DNA-binding protein YbaB